MWAEPPAGSRTEPLYVYTSIANDSGNPLVCHLQADSV